MLLGILDGQFKNTFLHQLVAQVGASTNATAWDLGGGDAGLSSGGGGAGGTTGSGGGNSGVV